MRNLLQMKVPEMIFVLRWLSRLLTVTAASVLCSPTFSAARNHTRYSVTDIGTLGGAESQAYYINALGQVVGQAQTSTGEWHAFLWSGGKISDLGTLGGKHSVANQVDESGEVDGESDTVTGETHNFHWAQGHIVDLGKMKFPALGKGQAATRAKYTLINTSLQLLMTGLNHQGHAVAELRYFMIDGNYQPTPHGYFWTSRGLLDLGKFVFPRGINDNDQVVGDISTVVVKNAYVNGADEMQESAFLWEHGRLVDLNMLISPSSDYRLTNGWSINKRGWILCSGYRRSRSHIAINNIRIGQSHALLLRPE